MEEVKARYVDFLHLGYESDQGIEQQPDQPDQPDLVDSDQNEPDDTEEVTVKEVEVEDNLNHEVEELRGESIQAAFEDYEFWKPQVDYNLDELLKEMNKAE